jgi:mono/diheme cytochrome c family protein
VNGRPLRRPFALTVTVATLFVGALPVPLAAQGAALPLGITEEMVRTGEQLFKAEGNCSACHGEDATGARGVGADLTDDDWWHSDGSYEAIVRTITSGVSSENARNAYGAMMPPRGGSWLTDEQVRAVAAYVWGLRRGRTGTR